jgi:hypothetical protein
MAELTFTQQEIDELTELLGSLAAALREPQGRLLMAVFAAGVDTVERIPESKPGTPDQPGGSGGPAEPEGRAAPDSHQLRDQLRQSFVPDDTPRPRHRPRPLVVRVSP